MKKLLLFLTIFFSLTIAQGQLYPIKNLTYQQSYDYGNYSCPSFNCFSLFWTEPDNSASDSLIGYNIYRNDVLYLFTDNTHYGCNGFDTCTFTSPVWYSNMPFWITVKAVYNLDSALSIADDSVEVVDIWVDINEQSDKIYFSFSPNPFSSETTLQINFPFKDAILKIYNSFGQQVKQINNISGQTIILHRDNMASGVYFLLLLQDDRTLTTAKLVITD